MRHRKILDFLTRKAPHLALLATLFGVSLLVGAHLRDRIPLHWDGYGVVDRVGSKFELILPLPVAAAVVLAAGLFAESRFILPSRKTRGLISFMQFFFLVLFFALHARDLLRAGGVPVPLERMMTLPALLLFVYLAGALDGAEHMSPLGVSTKWTLKSQTVWERTNHIAALMFRASAGLMLVPAFFPRAFFIFLLIPPVLSFVIPAIYSKMIYRAE